LHALARGRSNARGPAWRSLSAVKPRLATQTQPQPSRPSSPGRRELSSGYLRIETILTIIIIWIYGHIWPPAKVVPQVGHFKKRPNAPNAPPRAAPLLATEPMTSSKMLPSREGRCWAWAEALGEVGPGRPLEHASGDSMRDPRSMPRPGYLRPKLYGRSMKVPSEGSRREQRLRASSCVLDFPH
jgi:hypothetical protein